jgi:polysaccharide biosynthesis protein PelF
MHADVGLIIEGAYPYVVGGVSSWVHDLIGSQPDRTFHLIVLSVDGKPQERRYTLPANVIGFTEVPLQRSGSQVPEGRAAEPLLRQLEQPLRDLLGGGGLTAFHQVLKALKAHRRVATYDQLLNSEPAYELVERLYEHLAPGTSFLDFFWSWRSLVGGMMSVLLVPLPPARTYHAISTGYAGLMLARGVLERDRPGIVTEHGIYTNERRIEIAMADWLRDANAPSLGIRKPRRDLRDLWMDAFMAYSRICYRASRHIITLYGGNQELQARDGARPDRLRLIPNGVDVARYASRQRSIDARRPTVALIGRIVAIKDVKTFLRAVALLRQQVPDVLALLLGPVDEDPAYARECRDLIEHLDLQACVKFKGQVDLRKYLDRIDVVALTSVSEAQPLVLLEAGAAGIPCVATDVGACREIIEGRADESPPLGAGGRITPLSHPERTAQALAELLLSPQKLAACGAALQRRIRREYSSEVVHQAYRELYQSCVAAEGSGAVTYAEA